MKTNWPLKKLGEADKDLLKIRRDGLLKKKRLLDAVEKLRQQAREGQKQLETNCFYITESTGVQEWNPLMDLLHSLESKDTILFEVDDDFHHGDPWGYNAVVITIGENFDEFSKKIREEYHQLNKKIGKTEKNIENNKWVCYTNPIWLISKVIKFLWNHKIITLLFFLLSLLAIDYSLAWKNLNSIKNFIFSFWVNK